MSGQAGMRGYVIQTLVAVLDSLQDPNWIAIHLEPGGDQEKADILWVRPEGTRAVQVRHSTSHITLAMASGWAKEFAEGCVADEYELRIAGPVAGSLVPGTTLGTVKVPPPEPTNIPRLAASGAHALNRFFERIGISAVPAFAQEVVFDALTAKFAGYSTSGQRVPRADFERQLREWVVALYPNAMNEAALGLQARFDRDLEDHRLQLAFRLEAFKHDQTRLTILHERRADGVARIWEKLRSVEDALQDVFKAFVFEGELPQEERLNKALGVCRDLVRTWDSVAVFLPELDDEMDAVTDTVSDIGKSYSSSRLYGAEPEERTADYNRARKLAHTTLPDLRLRVRAVINDLLGLPPNHTERAVGAAETAVAATDVQPHDGEPSPSPTPSVVPK